MGLNQDYFQLKGFELDKDEDYTKHGVVTEYIQPECYLSLHCTYLFNTFGPAKKSGQSGDLVQKQKVGMKSNVVHHRGKKVWLDPNEANEISNANFRQQIQKLTKDGLIIQKPVTVHSWA
ncbi:hypothetical protein A6R68_04437 [Neotoma lepida]|uniref:Ribosomal protein L19e N-terminal domain-containing protein n=1 Tax=Neotoma lepida TaxID=56216 RepID=A0A1A6GMD5_NEOLE|nr:hypothetical protein A6R68_04437 [Neotoma lepida]